MKPTRPTDEDIIKIMSHLAFIVESVAHLQGRERDLLPYADCAREVIAAMKGGKLCAS